MTAKKPQIKLNEPQMIPVDQIKPAAYNPRHITPVADQKLNRGLKDFGLVETLVWNRRTGNLVGGHQRLRHLIRDQGWKPGDEPFAVPCTVVDLDDTREKELNVLLNNWTAQGEWDYKALGRMLEEAKEFDIDHAGIDLADLMAQPDFGQFDLDHLIPERHRAEGQDEIADIKANRRGHNEKTGQAAADLAGNAVTVLFPTADAADAWVSAVGFTAGQRFIDGPTVAMMMGVAAGVDAVGAGDTDPDPAGETGDGEETAGDESGSPE